ncbi:MAG: putative hydrolase of the superfamily [Frankiaceae bacterium]|jgi:putative hydrolase of the HAD superfamily|nr:putative hydrolase of the superfamily [Frankiaceae bacterium]
MVWVLFDYALVISEPQPLDAMAGMAAALGADAAAFEAAYWLHRDAYDRGELSYADYWAGVAATLGATTDEDITEDLNERDVDSWLVASAGTLAVITDLVGAGVPVAVLSNAPLPIALAVSYQEWAALFDGRLYFSSQLGASKPSPEVFRRVVAELGATADDVVFVDDRADNIAAARAVGLRSLLFTDAAELREDLRSLGLL